MLTHEVVTNGVVAETLSATFVVSGKETDFPAGAVSLTGWDGVYDGATHAAGVTAEGIDGLEALWWTGAIAGAGGATAPAITDVGSLTAWCVVTAPGYLPLTNSVTLAVAKRPVTLTSASASKVYDGTALVKEAVAAPAMAEDGWNTDFTSGWRLTVGGAMGGNMRTRLHTRGPKVATPVAASSGSRAAAQAAGDALDVDGSSRVEFPNGAYIDPNDSAGVTGETWNWKIPAGALDSNYTMSFKNTYSVSSISESYGDVAHKSDDYLAGFDIGFDRNLYKKGAFGVDLGFGFAFFRNHDFYKSGGTYYSSSSTAESGAYVTAHRLADAGSRRLRYLKRGR